MKFRNSQEIFHNRRLALDAAGAGQSFDLEGLTGLASVFAAGLLSLAAGFAVLLSLLVDELDELDALASFFAASLSSRCDNP